MKSQPFPRVSCFTAWKLGNGYLKNQAEPENNTTNLTFIGIQVFHFGLIFMAEMQSLLPESIDTQTESFSGWERILIEEGKLWEIN
jgi:hypothetical protein